MKDQLLASLIYICRHYNNHLPAQALVYDLPLIDGQLTPHLLASAAEKAKLISEPASLDLENLDNLLLPVITRLTNGGYAVITEISAQQRKVLVHSAATELTQWQNFDHFNESYSGECYLFKPEYQFDQRTPPVLENEKQRWFWDTLRKSSAIYKDVLLVSIFINLFAIASPLFSRIVYDKVVPNLAFDTLWVLSSGVLIVILFDFIFKSVRSYFIDIAGKKSDLLISSAIFSKVLSLKMASRPNSIGVLAKHMQEFESIREFFTSASIASLIDLPFALFFLLIIWIIGGPIAIVPVIGMLLLLAYSLLKQKTLKQSIEAGSRLSSQKNATLIDALIGLESIKLFNLQNRFQYRWEESVANAGNWSIKTRKITDSISHVASFIQQAVNVVMIIVGVYLISKGQLTMGTLIASTMLCSRAIGPLVQISMLLTRYSQAKSSLAILENLMQLSSEVTPDKQYLNRSHLAGNVTLEKVNFSYPEAEAVTLDNLSLSIKAGEKVAILGRVGSGKTSLLRLISGLYQPQSGAVLIDNTDINQIHPANLRQQMACVPQETNLFFGSVKDNITLGRNVTDEQILAISQAVGIDQFTARHPSGLDRQVGENGHHLSGGQRQAIAIARALITPTNLVILDEPTSHQDNRSEAIIKQHLANLPAATTLILITHKSSMLDLCDRIIILEQGKVVADGNKQEILSKFNK